MVSHSQREERRVPAEVEGSLRGGVCVSHRGSEPLPPSSAQTGRGRYAAMRYWW